MNQALIDAANEAIELQQPIEVFHTSPSPSPWDKLRNDPTCTNNAVESFDASRKHRINLEVFDVLDADCMGQDDESDEDEDEDEGL